MKVYTLLLALAPANKDAYLVVDGNDHPPIWTLKEDDRQSLDMVRDGFKFISGVSPNYFGEINQVGTFEFFDQTYKKIYIVYTIHFPQIFDLENLSYRWIKISECKEDGFVYNIIRYILSQRK